MLPPSWSARAPPALGLACWQRRRWGSTAVRVLRPWRTALGGRSLLPRVIALAAGLAAWPSWCALT
eukprot:3614827-Alexandrium_andersonii.AAC.1